MKILDALLRLFFPPKCICCGKILPFSSLFPYCDGCFLDVLNGAVLRKSSTPVENIKDVYILYSYTNKNVQKSVFHAKKLFSKPFSEFYKYSCKRLFENENFIDDIDLVTYCTRRSSEIRREGIDQAKEMAKAVSSLTDIPYAKTLMRTRRTKKQRLLSTDERFENVSGAFRAKGDVSDKRILLLDDVMTTGATLSQCALELKNAGAKSVIALTFAC